MGLFSYDIKSFDDLFIHGLRDIHYAENRIAKALAELIRKASDPALKRAFESHLAETGNRIERLEQVFRIHDIAVESTPCPAIDAIIQESDDIAREIAESEVLDAALTSAAQAVEHYEITRYGSLVAWARQLGRTECADLLQQTLDEEKMMDAKLTALARLKINRKAA